MDPASLTLAILPLALTAIKGFHMLHKRMKTFCHYSREIHRLRKHLDRQRHFFHNEVHLLIQIALKDELMVENMMEDSQHARWHCKDLERSLRSLLGKNYDTCLEVSEEISGTVRELEDEMQCFNQVESHRQDGELLKDAVRRLRGSLKITWDKSKFDSSYADLRNHNDDLRRLRRQASEIEGSKMPARDIRVQIGAEYSSCGAIRRASRALHCAFTDSWSDVPTGLRHVVKLFIDAKVEEKVRMDVAVLCYGHDISTLHSIYHDMEKKRLKPQKLAVMSQMWGRPMESAMTVVDQLKLARNMVLAVLKFHATPWLRQYFVADDFRFFEDDAELSSCLRTLHFSADMISKGYPTPAASFMQGVEIPDASKDLTEEVENAKIQYGIRNMTLWSLGAILLQIGRWTKINSPDDVFTVRKLSSQVPPLGPRYQQLTKKCLDCDFGYGDDLAKPRLQQALYENLVCELTDMIEGLSICG